MKSRIFSTTWAGSKIFTLLPKVEIHAKKVGLISMGAVMVKWSSSTGIIKISLPNWSITASASSLRNRIFTEYSFQVYGHTACFRHQDRDFSECHSSAQTHQRCYDPSYDSQTRSTCCCCVHCCGFEEYTGTVASSD